MNQLSLLPDMATKARRPIEPIVREASVGNGCRWWLKRAWGAGPCILWMMCNPSDADSKRDDPTMWRVMEFSSLWGYGSCIVVNPIPYISSTPAAALEWAKRARGEIPDGFGERDQWISNIYHVSHMMALAEAHVAAWGNNLPHDLVQEFLQELAETVDPCDCELPPVEWLCLGTNSNNSPRHPLSRGRNRVPHDFKPVRWKQ